MLCSTAFCPTSSRALYARARVNNKKHIFSCAEQRWEHSRLFELALLTKPSKNVPEKAVRKTLSVSRRSVSQHSAPLHPCSYTHGITNIFKKSPGADQPNGRNLRHGPGAVKPTGEAKPSSSKKLFEKTAPIHHALLRSATLNITPCISMHGFTLV